MAASNGHPIRLSSDPFCECVRGDWGQPCPVCGRRLPPQPGPLRSWHAAKAIDADRSAQARDSLVLTQSFRRWHI